MLKNLKTKCVASVNTFHSEEDGVEAIQAVIILAVAAVAMLVIKGKWQAITTFFNDNVSGATGTW